MTALECDASGFLRLCDVSRLTERELPQTMSHIGSRAADIAQSMAPVDSGTLRGSISSMHGRDGNTFWAQIGTNVFYAPYQEFGTGRRGSSLYVARDGSAHETGGLTFRGDWTGMAPNPYIRPALYDFKSLYITMINEAVKKSVKRGGSA